MHISCTSLLILLFIKSKVYCPAHFILLHILFFLIFFSPIFMYILLCCVTYFALSTERTWFALLIIFCIIEYVTNKTLYPWILYKCPLCRCISSAAGWADEWQRLSMSSGSNGLRWGAISQQAGRVFSHGELSSNASSPKFIRAHDIVARPPLVSHPSFCFSCSHICWWRRRKRDMSTCLLWMSLWPHIFACPQLSDGRRGRAICPSRAELHLKHMISKSIFLLTTRVLPLCSQPLHPFQPLATRAEAWQAITTVRRGYTLQFARGPPRFSGVLATTVRSEDTQALRAAVRNLLEKGAIEIIPPAQSKSGFYSRYFLVLKKDGGLRPILDLRLLNYALMKRSSGWSLWNRSSRKYAQGTGSCRWIWKMRTFTSR